MNTVNKDQVLKHFLALKHVIFFNLLNHEYYYFSILLQLFKLTLPCQKKCKIF